MKSASSLLLLLCGLLFGTLASGAGSAGTVWIAGLEYVRLPEWAQRHRLHSKWLTKATLQLSNASAKFTFTVAARKMSVNGVDVWLSHAVVNRGGVPYISRLDVSTCLEPVLLPPKHLKGKVRRICLDPGHGGRDPGNREGNREEKLYTLLLARELKSELTKAGYEVVLTRNTDVALDLDERAAIARRAGADLLISLHFNSGHVFSRTIKGAEVYCLTPANASSTNAGGKGSRAGSTAGNVCNAQNFLLAYHIQKQLVQQLAMADRGVRRARFAVLRNATMPAVLVEGGFMSNAIEGRQIYDPSWRLKLAKAISRAVQLYASQTAS